MHYIVIFVVKCFNFHYLAPKTKRAVLFITEGEQYDFMVGKWVTVRVSAKPVWGYFVIMVVQHDPDIKNETITIPNRPYEAVFDLSTDKNKESSNIQIIDGVYGIILAKVIELKGEDRINVKMKIASKNIGKLLYITISNLTLTLQCTFLVH